MPDAVRPDALDERMIPPGVADARARAFVDALGRGLDEVGIDRFDLLDFDRVDAALLPSLVRGLSMEEFVTADMPERIVRRLLKVAIPLHVGKGRDRAVREAVAALEMDCQIAQWFRQVPVGAPNTNVTTVRIVNGWTPDQPASDIGLRRAAERAILATKRWSQDADIRFRIAAEAHTFSGAHGRFGGIVRIRALQPDPSLPPARVGTIAVARAGGRFRIGQAA